MNVTTSTQLLGKLEVTIPEETHAAGKPSIVRVIIHNPFPVEIEILEIVAPQSSLVRRIGNEKNIKNSKGSIDYNALKEKSGSKQSEYLNIIEKISEAFFVSSVSIGLGGISASFPGNSRRLVINADTGSTTKIERDLADFDEVIINADENSNVLLVAPEIETEKSLAETHIIQPGCDKVAYFTILSNGWIFFTPQRMDLSTEIRYKVSGSEKTQVVNSFFDIKPPKTSMVIGSMIGGGLGSIARVLLNNSSFDIQSAIISVGSSVIMSLIAAVALSRNSGTQGFITIEDFFGAFVIGSLIGYGGSEYFDRSVLPQGG